MKLPKDSPRSKRRAHSDARSQTISDTHSRTSSDDRFAPHAPEASEWVGGRVTSPFYVAEGTPYRPEMILWLELPDDVIVLGEVIDPKAPPVSFAVTLLQAMRSPLVGPPRRPRAVRVSDEQLAAEVRTVVPDARVVVAPTPELDRVLALMLEKMSETTSDDDEPEEEPSYFEDGRVPIETVELLFQNAQVLYHIAPWKRAGDSQLLRVDIPAYGVHGACLSIIGALGQSLGIILFQSFEGFERFVESAEAGRRPGRPIDLGTTTLSLNFEKGSDLPARMYREVLEHGWPVADDKAYPVVVHRDRDSTPRPLSERDVHIMADCAASLAAFFSKHGRLFARDRVDEPVCESYRGDDDIEVRFTLPYKAWDQFRVNDPPREGLSGPPRERVNDPSRNRVTDFSRERVSDPPRARESSGAPKIGRNDPCPCGSGRKYKVCCLRSERESSTPASTGMEKAAVHDLDEQLFDRMDRFARRRFGSRWIVAAGMAFPDPTVPGIMELMGPWVSYHTLFGGKTLVEWFLENPDRPLSNRDRSWLDAQGAAWLSIWEVQAVEPGASITLRDLLTGEDRVVREVMGSRTLVARDSILARVVDHEGSSVLCGIYPRALPPRETAAVIQRVQDRLRRKKNVPVDRLRPEVIGRYLIACWDEAVKDFDARASIPPELQNTDGDPLLLTIDHFAFGAADRSEIQRRLAAADGVEDPPEADDPEQVYVFTKPGNRRHKSWESTVIGRVVISGEKLIVETNSIKRADSMRALVETALEPMIRHRAREHVDPMSPRAREARSGPTAAQVGIPPEEENRLILEMKAKHYADWIDQPVPALGDETPRAAIRTKDGRQMVDLLIKEIENHESRVPAGHRFDFGGIRRELGL